MIIKEVAREGNIHPSIGDYNVEQQPALARGESSAHPNGDAGNVSRIDDSVEPLGGGWTPGPTLSVKTLRRSAV